MRVKSFRVRNIKSFADSGSVELGPITLFVGPNNSGKSTLIRGLSLMQAQDPPLGPTYKRTQEDHILLEANLEDIDKRHWPGVFDHSDLVGKDGMLLVDYYPAVYNLLIRTPSGDNAVSQIINIEPHNFIYPYLSKRKVARLSEVVNIAATTAVSGDLKNLAAKVDRLNNPEHPNHDLYASMCKKVLGFVVSAFASGGGKQAGILTGAFGTIGIDDMGEGVASLTGLIVDLCIADNNLFLIEELENDVHPQALKALLDLIVERSSSNQFVISTHSNIVLRHLGSESATHIYRIGMERENLLPTSSVSTVDNSLEDRAALLAELGYELRDFDLWDGWLFLEESSAERLIRDYFVRWFVPGLASVRTIAVGGVSKAEPTFEDFNRLFRFTHLERVYRGRAWVILDGDTDGLQAVGKLRETYADWPAENFTTWSSTAFEHYYPERFSDFVAKALAEADKVCRRELKRELLNEVLGWIRSDEVTARQEFEASAADVLVVLRDVERLLGLVRGAIKE